jgi:hypothetical protein
VSEVPCARFGSDAEALEQHLSLSYKGFALPVLPSAEALLIASLTLVEVVPVWQKWDSNALISKILKAFSNPCVATTCQSAKSINIV